MFNMHFSEYIPMEGLEQSRSQSCCTRQRSSLKSEYLCWKLLCEGWADSIENS